MTETQIQIPGYVAGRWAVDPVHSYLGFVIKHMMVSKVRGRFTEIEASIVTAADPVDSSVTATIQTGSIDTNNSMRDDHIRSADFFDAANHPTLSFASTGIRHVDGQFFIDGNLTIRGTTKPVTLQVETPSSARTRRAARRPASQPRPRSTATTSGSATTGRFPAAAWHWATRSRSCSKSRPTCSTEPSGTAEARRWIGKTRDECLSTASEHQSAHTRRMISHGNAQLGDLHGIETARDVILVWLRDVNSDGLRLIVA
jgi:polyisoprenoid-binding protein YceI